MCIIKAGLCYQLSEQARGWHSADSQWEHNTNADWTGSSRLMSSIDDVAKEMI